MSQLLKLPKNTCSLFGNDTSNEVAKVFSAHSANLASQHS